MFITVYFQRMIFKYNDIHGVSLSEYPATKNKKRMLYKRRAINL